MKIILQKESFLNSIKAVRAIVNARGSQPIMASILLETSGDDKVKLTSTDLNLSMCYQTPVKVEKEGKIAISARVLEEIITKLPEDKDIILELNEEKTSVTIKSEKTKYEVLILNPDEFPNVFDVNRRRTEEDEAVEHKFEISAKYLNKAIKQTAFAAVQNEAGGVLTGICFTINENTLEMVATDGNRLTRCRVPINSRNETLTFICPYRTLIEISKLISNVKDENINFTVKGTKILFEFEDILFQSGIIEGTYPKYQQLIPTTNEKSAKVAREKFLNTIDRVSVMVNNRTNIMKFNFEDSSLEISTDTPEAGSAKERMDIEYDNENLLIAFNYRYIVDVLRNTSTRYVRIEMSTNLSAAVLIPEANAKCLEDDSEYICLIMPVQVR